MKGFGLHGKISNIKVILNGGQSVTYLRPDGFFSLYPSIFENCILDTILRVCVSVFLLYNKIS